MRNRKNCRGTETTIGLQSNEPRHFVYNMIAELDPEGLEARSLQKPKKQKKEKKEKLKPKGQVKSRPGVKKFTNKQNKQTIHLFF